VTMAAGGLGAGLYTYLKDYAAAKWRGEDARFWDRARMKKAKWALLAGCAGGAFGSWLAGTEFFQPARETAKDLGGKALSVIFNSAQAAELPAVEASAPAAPVLPEPATVPTTTALEKLSALAALSDDAGGKKLAASLAKANLEDMNSVSPQFLKD